MRWFGLLCLMVVIAGLVWRRVARPESSMRVAWMCE